MHLVRFFDKDVDTVNDQTPLGFYIFTSNRMKIDAENHDTQKLQALKTYLHFVIDYIRVRQSLKTYL